MKAISLENLLGIIPNWNYNGCEDEFEYNGKKYLPLTTVIDWYIYREKWVEEIDINED